MMRWAAVVGWLAAAGFVLSQLISNPEPSWPVDLAPTTLCLAIAGLITLGGRIGRIGALIGTGAASFATLAGLIFAVSGRGNWLIAFAAVLLLAVSYAAARQMKETLPAG